MKVNGSLVIALLFVVVGVAIFAVWLDRAGRTAQTALVNTAALDSRVTALERNHIQHEAKSGMLKTAAKFLLGWIPGLKG